MQFNFYRKINDLQYLEGDHTPKVAREANVRRANVQSVQTIVPERSSNLKQSDIMFVKTLRNIGREEKLFVDYETFPSLYAHIDLERLN